MQNKLRTHLSAAASALSLLGAGAALACPACLGTSGPRLTLVQQMIDSDESVVAARGRDSLHFIVQSSIKGARKPGDEISLSIEQAPWNGVAGDGGIILGRHLFTRQWVALGTIGPRHEAWLKQLAAMKRTKELNDQDWAERASFFVDFLADPDPLVRSTAYGELARAPYAAMRAVKPKLDRARLLGGVSRGADGESRALLILLLGLEGSDAARRWISDALEQAQRDADSTSLAALVTAFLEVSGRDGLAHIEEAYAGDAARGADEIHAVVVSLGVQGSRGGRLAQQDIVPVFRKILAQHPEAAGAIAEIMNNWSRFDLADGMARTMTDMRVDEGSRLLIANYLLSSGRAKLQ